MELLNRAVGFVGSLSPWIFLLFAVVTVIASAIQVWVLRRTRMDSEHRVARADERAEATGQRTEATFTVSIVKLNKDAQDELVHSVQKEYLRVVQKYGEESPKEKTFTVHLPASRLGALVENITNSTSAAVLASEETDK